MAPTIMGIRLYPNALAILPWGTIPSGIDGTTVPCITHCEVNYASSIKHTLVCEANMEGDSEHIFVTGMIRCHSNQSSIKPYTLTSMKLDSNNRVYWPWPNLNEFRKINADYDIFFKLVKMFADQGPTVVWVIDQGPFTVKILPPPDPITPKPSA